MSYELLRVEICRKHTILRFQATHEASIAQPKCANATCLIVDMHRFTHLIDCETFCDNPVCPSLILIEEG